MKKIIVLLTFASTALFAQQKYKCGAMMAMDGTTVNVEAYIDINESDSIITFSIILSKKESVVKYKILSKSINGDSYKASDGVTDCKFFISPTMQSFPRKITSKYSTQIRMEMATTSLFYFGNKN